MDPSKTGTLTISVCLLRPFYKLLANYRLVDAGIVERARSHAVDARIPLKQAHALLESAIQLTGDPDLGLKAGRISDFEDGGTVAYAAGSAPTVRQAILVGTRYMRLLNDAMDFKLVVEGSRALVRMDSRLPLPRSSADFQASAVRTHHRRTHAMEIPGLEWWFTHDRPSSTEEYERTFGKTTLRFSMPHFGFCFDARYLDVPQTTADARQYEILVMEMEAALAGIPSTAPLTDRVRDLIVRRLPAGDLTIVVVAKELGMSRRTLTRRLFEENTSFSTLLEDTRKRMALHYLEHTDRSISSIAFLLGFSEVPTFYRAFKRWTDATPLSFRPPQHLAPAGESPSE